MPATCDRHIKLLNLIEQSPEEYSLSKADRGETAGRSWLPKFLFRPWNMLFSFLFKRIFAIISYFLHRIGLAKKLKLL